MRNLANILRQRRLTREKLRARTGLTEARLDQIIQGAEPTLDELAKISRALGISPRILVRDLTTQSDIAPLFRRDAASDVDDFTISALAEKVTLAVDIMGGSRPLPAWLGQFGLRNTSYLEAERMAGLFRDLFFGGDSESPLLDLPTLLGQEANVFCFVLNERHFDGASAINNGYLFAFVARRYPARMLFTLAHELAHLIAHHQNGGYFHVDKNCLSHWTSSRFEAEAFANAFASCLLLPRKGVGVALDEFRKRARISSDAVGDIEVLFLARAFGVSFEVAARRLEDLTLLPKGSAPSLYKYLLKHHGGPEKRAAQVNLPPRHQIDFSVVPRDLAISAAKSIERGNHSLGQVSNVFGWPAEMLVDANARRLH